MENSCKIKLGSVNNLTDARFGAAAGAEWIGFRFDGQHPLHISPVQAEAIIGWLEGPKAVAEFSAHHSLNEIEDIVRLLGFEWIQLPGADMLHFFEGSDVKVILEVDLEKEGIESLKNTSEAIGCFLIRNYKAQDVTAIKKQRQEILFDVEGLAKAELEQLKEISPYGINISGGFETAPGLRDFDEMSEVFDLFGEF